MPALDPQAVFTGPAALIARAIPRTNERRPIVGLGSSATFAQVAPSDDVAALRTVSDAAMRKRMTQLVEELP